MRKYIRYLIHHGDGRPFIGFIGRFTAKNVSYNKKVSAYLIPYEIANVLRKNCIYKY